MEKARLALKRIKSIPLFLKDKKVAFYKKLLIIGGIVYLVLPFDIIPPIIPVFGMLDDVILWIFIINYLKDELDKYDPDAPAYGKYKDRNVIDAQFEVNDQEQKEQ